MSPKKQNYFEWTPKRVQEFASIYAGNFQGKDKRFKRKDFIGLRYDAKVKKYKRLVTKLEGKDKPSRLCECNYKPSLWNRIKRRLL